MTTNTEQKSEKQVAIEKASNTIESAIAECGVVAIQDQPAFLQAIRLAHGIKMLKGALTDDFVRAYILPLQGSALGFITDKDSAGGYDMNVVREVACEALLRGFRLTGNEFNIISGRFYGAKNGFERIVMEYPGLRDLRVTMGVPHLVADKGALVPCVASWLYHGESDSIVCAAPAKDGEMDTRIPIRVNSGMGPDAILGKATRKLFARVYQRLTGCARDVVDSEPGETVAVPGEALPAPALPEHDGRRIKMNGGSAKAAAAAAEPATRQPGEDG